jgi:beta-glucosidase
MQKIVAAASIYPFSTRNSLHRFKPVKKNTISYFVFLTLCVVLSASGIASGSSDPTSTQDIDAKVKQLLGKMTLEEKVGQMTQMTLAVISTGAGDPSDQTGPTYTAGSHSIDAAKLEDALIKHHVGSILNVTSSAFSVDHWHEILNQIQDEATKKTRLHIPVIYGIDAIHGATYTLGSTLFPQAVAMAATFNRDMTHKEGEITAREVKASGIPWNFYPVMDVGRQLLWSRLYETYGEDTYLATALGASYIDGHQSQGVAPCLKHYVGYSFPWSGKDRTPAFMTERMLRETFLPPFEAGIRAGAPTIMINSGEVDGIPGHANHHLLTDILRGELHFKGFTVSDWQDIERLYTRDRVAQSPKDAVRIAVMAGVDMSMVPFDYSFYDLLIELVKEGSVPMSRINQAVGRILRVKYQIGLFEHPYPDESLKKNIGLADATAANLTAAQEAITLLKNDDAVLPLSKKSKVMIAGPNADLLSVLNGGWTITWQGDQEALYPKDKKTVLKAIQDKIGESNVIYATDTDYAVQRASSVDAIILCLGEKTYTETPGNIDDLTLDAAQLDLATKLEKSGKPVILVMIEGRPRVIRTAVDGAKSIVMAYLPGMEGGQAIADVLFGDVNPSGKLPFTYPRSPDSLTPYDHTAMEEEEGNVFNPEFPFGTGLSYTNFKYSNLTINHDTISKDESLKVSVTVTNTGKVAGKESVLLYMTDEFASVARPVKELRGFDKVMLQPGDSKTLEFTLKPYDFSFINESNRRVIEPGPFKVAVGPLVKDFTIEDR